MEGLESEAVVSEQEQEKENVPMDPSRTKDPNRPMGPSPAKDPTLAVQESVMVNFQINLQGNPIYRDL